MRFVIKNAVCLYLKICLPLEREAYFQKNHEKKGRKVKNGAGRPYMASVMAICGGLAFRFDFLKILKIKIVLRALGRKHFFEGDKFGVYFRFGFL